ncbi:hypothetical protein GLOIN_2v1781868 [Rhizophagus irregularis DAOM 181602=DAOM 197198]|nr:hypothetical protein GLOIN_2v1781868 [Rhizophagus irregularis DAOM 181602=DAOM 197198]CAG8748736.1 19904_t:CDS:2 [Rhizophagus irregularis]
MFNVYTLKDIKNRGHWLGSAYEQEFKKKLKTAIDFNSEIIDFNEKLQAENLEYSDAKVKSQLISEWKSHSESQHELEAKYIAKIKSLKSSIKTLKREATLVQKASFTNKIKIFSFEAKVYELEDKLDDLELEQVFHDPDAVGGLLEEPVQINSSDPKEIDSLRFELERANENLSSKEYTIECIEKGIEKNAYLQELLSKKEPRGTSHNKVDILPLPMNNLSCTTPSSKPSAFNPSSQ